MLGYRIVRGIALAYAKFFHRIEIIGKENELKEGGCIAIANHSSFFDPLAVAVALKRDVYFMAKSDLEKFAPMRWLFKMCNVTPVRRGESDMAALRKSFDIINGGNVMGVFPQGTRIPCPAPDVETAQAGIGLMALKTKAPILPISICYGKKDKPTLFRKVKVVIGKPVYYEEYSVINGEKAGSHEISKFAFAKVCENFTAHNDG